MTEAPIILIILLAVIVSAILVGLAVRSIWREMQGLGDGDDAESGGRETREEAKNRRIAAELEARRDREVTREVEQWREGR